MRPPLDTSGGRPTSGAELNLARQLIERSGIVEVLDPFVDSEVGRPRHLSLLGFLVACQLNALSATTRPTWSRWPGSSTP